MFNMIHKIFKKFFFFIHLHSFILDNRGTKFVYLRLKQSVSESDIKKLNKISTLIFNVASCKFSIVEAVINKHYSYFRADFCLLATKNRRNKLKTPEGNSSTIFDYAICFESFKFKLTVIDK